jgi:uncharacterized damage-inducible protein DinB
MRKRKSLIFAEQIVLFHNEKGWYPPVSKVVQGLTLEQAKWKGGEQHSIWELLTHLTFWNERWLSRFRLETVDELDSNEATFAREAADRGDERAWAGLVERFDHVMTAWKEELLACDDAKMDEALSFDPDCTWWEALSCLTTHNTYHLGQMVYIRKQQGL